MPLTTILEGAPLEAEIVNTLLGKESRYADWLAILLACQRGEWDAVIVLAADYGIVESDLFSAWASALRWSSEFFSPNKTTRRRPSGKDVAPRAHNR